MKISLRRRTTYYWTKEFCKESREAGKVLQNYLEVLKDMCLEIDQSSNGGNSKH